MHSPPRTTNVFFKQGDDLFKPTAEYDVTVSRVGGAIPKKPAPSTPDRGGAGTPGRSSSSRHASSSSSSYPPVPLSPFCDLLHPQVSSSSSSSRKHATAQAPGTLTSLSPQTYLDHSKIELYLKDALSTLLAVATEQSSGGVGNQEGGGGPVSLFDSATARPLRFLSNYFQNVLAACNPAPSNSSYLSSTDVGEEATSLESPLTNTQLPSFTAGKPFTFIVSTVYNRFAFLRFFSSSCSPIFSSERLSSDDFHALLVLFCPTFCRSITQCVTYFVAAESNSQKGRASKRAEGSLATPSGPAGGSPGLIAGASPLSELHPFPALLRALIIYFYHFDFFLQLQLFFLAAYDGAMSLVTTPFSSTAAANDNASPQQPKSSILMPPLSCDVNHSPLREYHAVYTPSVSGKTVCNAPSPTLPSSSSTSWRRSFSCAVDGAHVSVALRRIDRGMCGGARPPRDVVAECFGQGVGGSGGAGADGDQSGIKGQKMTLETVWTILCRHKYFDDVIEHVVTRGGGTW